MSASLRSGLIGEIKVIFNFIKFQIRVKNWANISLGDCIVNYAIITVPCRCSKLECSCLVQMKVDAADVHADKWRMLI